MCQQIRFAFEMLLPEDCLKIAAQFFFIRRLFFLRIQERAVCSICFCQRSAAVLQCCPGVFDLLCDLLCQRFCLVFFCFCSLPVFKRKFI